MNNEDYLKVVEFLNLRLQGEVTLLRTSGNTDDLVDYLEFLGIVAAIDIMTVLQPNEVKNQLDIINGLRKYNEHYYQKLVVDMLVYSNTMEGKWEGLAFALESSIKALQESSFIPAAIAERLDTKSITDPYIAILLLIKDSATATLVREARRNAK